ncbi:MAG: hypothetical protein IJ594_00785 [Oscillospiraceae bacterium]|nr:hypothetical protein [Oscillospiraceae bacterium]
MNNWYSEDVSSLFQAIASLETEEECRQFFEDACTVREILEIAQRLKVAKMLNDKASYSTINRETGVSSATISRVSRCLDYGSGGYRLVIERMEKGTQA